MSGALFLYNATFVIAVGLLRLGDSSVSIFRIGNMGGYAVMAAAGCCGLLALPDKKTSLTVIVSGLFLRSLLGLLVVSPAARALTSIGWLAICGSSAFVLWWLWLGRPREPGDAPRMSMALTVLVSAEALSAAYSYASHPSRMQARQMVILAIVIGSLLWLRVRIPSAIGGVTYLGRDHE